MTTATLYSRPVSKVKKLTETVIKKGESIPGIAVAAFVGLLVGMCLYFGTLETYAPITNWYHNTLPFTDYWRHLVFRASPETLFAAWFAQCVAVIAVVGNQLKPYRVFRTHEIFWRPLVGVIAAIPGAAVAALAVWFFHLSDFLTASVSAHPGVSDQLAQAVALDGNKKVIVLVGSLSAIWYMKPYFLNIQGWLAENRIIAVRARNAARTEVGTSKMVPYVRFYHYLFPGLVDRTKFIVANEGRNVLTTKGGSVRVTLNEHNHRPVNRAIYKMFNVVVAAGVFGGLYIMFFIAQHQYLQLSVVH